jgi:hypothetical protein
MRVQRSVMKHGGIHCSRAGSECAETGWRAAARPPCRKPVLPSGDGVAQDLGLISGRGRNCTVRAPANSAFRHASGQRVQHGYSARMQRMAANRNLNCVGDGMVQSGCRSVAALHQTAAAKTRKPLLDKECRSRNRQSQQYLMSYIRHIYRGENPRRPLALYDEMRA